MLADRLDAGLLIHGDVATVIGFDEEEPQTTGINEGLSGPTFLVTAWYDLE